MFGVLRFLAGLGLGGCLPTAIAMVNEFSRSGRSGRATTTVMTGYHVGAVTTAALAIVVIPNLGWEWMFVLGALPALVLVPLMLRFLPESAAYLVAHGRRAEAEEVARRHGLELEDPAAPVAAARRGDRRRDAQDAVHAAYLRNTVVLGVTSFMGLLLVYGLNSWLPTIMREADYELGAPGLPAGAQRRCHRRAARRGQVADRIGARAGGDRLVRRRGAVPALLSIKLPIGGIYVMVFLTGCFVFSAQVLVYAFVSANHPPQVRATALGWSAGAGRSAPSSARSSPVRCSPRDRVPVGLLRLRRRRCARRGVPRPGRQSPPLGSDRGSPAAGDDQIADLAARAPDSDQIADLVGRGPGTRRTAWPSVARALAVLVGEEPLELRADLLGAGHLAGRRRAGRCPRGRR